MHKKTGFTSGRFWCGFPSNGCAAAKSFLGVPIRILHPVNIKHHSNIIPGCYFLRDSLQNTLPCSKLMSDKELLVKMQEDALKVRIF